MGTYLNFWLILRQHFWQKSPPLSGPGRRAEQKNIFTFPDVADQKKRILFFPK